MYPFQQKEKIKPKEIMSDYTYFLFVFSHFLITVTMRISNYFTINVRMMNMSVTAHKTFDVFIKFSDI